MVSASRSETCGASSGASTSMSTSNRRVLRRSAAVVPCRPSKPRRERTRVGITTAPSSDAVAGFSGGFPLPLSLDDLALDRPDDVDEQSPGQVVVLVLERPGIQGLPLDLEGLAVEIGGPDHRAHSALDRHENAGKREAALVTAL